MVPNTSSEVASTTQAWPQRIGRPLCVVLLIGFVLANNVQLLLVPLPAETRHAIDLKFGKRVPNAPPSLSELTRDGSGLETIAPEALSAVRMLRRHQVKTFALHEIDDDGNQAEFYQRVIEASFPIVLDKNSSFRIGIGGGNSPASCHVIDHEGVVFLAQCL